MSDAGKDPLSMGGRPAAEVLALPVRFHGIQLGRPVEALLHADDDRIVGFVVRCGDGARRFLPFSVARIASGEITLESALTLIDDGDADFYRRRARPLSELDYAEPWIDADGGVHESRSAA
jgi:hypothetical protein